MRQRVPSPVPRLSLVALFIAVFVAWHAAVAAAQRHILHHPDSFPNRPGILGHCHSSHGNDPSVDIQGLPGCFRSNAYTPGADRVENRMLIDTILQIKGSDIRTAGLFSNDMAHLEFTVRIPADVKHRNGPI